MKVLYISNESSLGGAENSLIDMVKGMKKIGVCPIVIIPRKGIIEELLRNMEVKYYIVPFLNGYGKIGLSTKRDENDNFFNNYSAANELQDIIAKEKIQLVHINSSVSNVGAMAALIAKIPYVWHFREFLEEDFGQEFWDKELKCKLINSADKVITISVGVQDSYLKKYGVVSTQIYNGIDIDKYRIKDLDARLQIKDNEFIITGYISEGKGQWDAVRAVQLLVSEGVENIHLRLYGRGDIRYVWMLKRYISLNRLEKYIDIEEFCVDLSEVRKRCGYSLTTSRMEALGRCTIEAMLAGNIVIGADTGGTLELIGSKQNRGFLYKQGNYVDLADVMKRAIYLEAEKRKNILKEAQKYATEVFDLDSYCSKIITVYKDVLEKYTYNIEKEALLQKLNDRYDKLKLKNDVLQDSNNMVVGNICNPYDEITKKWNLLTAGGKSLGEKLFQKGIRTVAIYGMGNLGCRLFDEIYSSKVKIAYVVDKNSEYISEIVEVKKPEEDLGDVDMLIITVAAEESVLVNFYSSKYEFEVKGISELMNY